MIPVPQLSYALWYADDDKCIHTYNNACLSTSSLRSSVLIKSRSFLHDLKSGH